MKKITELYSLDERETILLDIFNQLPNDEQTKVLSRLLGYIAGRGFMNVEDSCKLQIQLTKEKD